jgi:hypothetical protein
VVPADLLAIADHEADLLGHPYLGLEHVELARLTLEGRLDQRAALRRTIARGVRKRWWRPHGPRSAPRSRALKDTEARRRAAEQEERRREEA